MDADLFPSDNSKGVAQSASLLSIKSKLLPFHLDVGGKCCCADNWFMTNKIKKRKVKCFMPQITEIGIEKSPNLK
jgi:hypothetical protein